MKHRWRSLASGTAALAVTAALVGVGGATSSADPQRPPACAQADPGQLPAPAPTTLTTVGQAYHCIFDNYYSGPVLDSRTLLVPAFAALTQEMQRRGLDRSDAELPVLTGHRDADWAAFSEVYRRIADALPDDAREAIGAAAIRAMVDELDDNHARWVDEFTRSAYGLELSAMHTQGDIDPVAAEPAHVTGIDAGSPAEGAGLKPGDEVLAVNDVPLFVNGVLNTGALSWLTDGGIGSTVKLTARRPATGEAFTATVTGARYPLPTREVRSRLVDGDIAYVALPGFAPELADEVLAAIADMRAKTPLRGVVLDLRGNGGGSPEAVAELLGALAHGKVTGYLCDIRNRCTPKRTDDSVELLGLPLVALVDRRCASACDSFSSAVKDLGLGTLVGTRTAGVVSGPGLMYELDNGTLVMLPKYHGLTADKGIVDTIGVAPDHFAPTTAADLSAGRDPALDKAVSLL